MKPDAIFILSAKYGLIDLDEIIEPYDEKLIGKRADEIKKWSENATGQISARYNLKKDKFIFLAGTNYRKYILSHIVDYEIPLKELGIGEQLSFLKNEINQ